MFGGYEYMPEEMNKRNDEWLKDKHEEALRIMPYLFDDNGYHVTVVSQPYGGYTNPTDLSVYDERPTIQKKSIATLFPLDLGSVWEKKFFYYSIMKTCPLALQNPIYREGRYFEVPQHVKIRFPWEYYEDKSYSIVEIGSFPQRRVGLSKAHGINNKFRREYGVMSALSDMADIVESGNTYLVLCSEITHEPMILKEPEYKPAKSVDNTDYDKSHEGRFTVDGRKMRMDNARQMASYHSNMAALVKVGEWLDFLKSQDVYDNTRIIIVADHGWYELKQFDDFIFGDGDFDDVMAWNPLLLVKDFDDDEAFKADSCFMTNADVPLLAFKGIIEHPINPFTGNELTDSRKYDAELYLMESNPDVASGMNNGLVFRPGRWYSVKNQNIFDTNNWKFLGKY
jgi:hypothetical protein